MSQAPEIRMLVAILDQAYDHPSWHGTNLRGSIRRVSPAAGRVAAGSAPAQHLGARRSRRVLEICRVAAPDRTGPRFVSAQRLELVSTARGADRACLAIGQGAARRNACVACAKLSGSCRRAELQSKPRGSKVSNFALLSGVAAHDLYHAGQIQLLKRLSTRK